MAPRLTPGDLLIVRQTPATAVREGDIVTFAHPAGNGRTITHRVRKIVHKNGLLYFETRGDANHESEFWAIKPTGRLGTLAHQSRTSAASPARCRTRSCARS